MAFGLSRDVKVGIFTLLGITAFLISIILLGGDKLVFRSDLSKLRVLFAGCARTRPRQRYFARWRADRQHSDAPIRSRIERNRSHHGRRYGISTENY